MMPNLQAEPGAIGNTKQKAEFCMLGANKDFQSRPGFGCDSMHLVLDHTPTRE